MKKALIILGIILVIVGIIVVAASGNGIGLQSGKYLFNHNLSNADACKTLELNNLSPTKLQIETNAYSVYLRVSENENISVKYVGNLPQDVQIKVSAENNVVYVTETDNFKHLSLLGGLFANSTMAKLFLLVEIPQSLFTDTNIILTTNVGKIDVESLSLASFSCTLNTGDIVFTDCTLDQVDMINNAGNVSLQNVTLQKLTVDVDAGTLNIGNLSCKTADLTVQAGTANVSGVIEDKLTVKVDAGTINCDATANTIKLYDNAGTVNLHVKSQNILVEVDVGNVKGVVYGNSSDYNIVVLKDVGTSNISTNNNVNAECTLNVSVNTGSINVNFENK